MPKGKTPSLISGSSGKPSIAFAKAKSHCARCGGVIVKGEKCFEIPKVGGGFINKKRHCKACFVLIIEKTKEDVVALEVFIKNDD